MVKFSRATVFILSVFITIFMLYTFIPQSVLYPDWLLQEGLENMRNKLHNDVELNKNVNVTDYTGKSKGLADLYDVEVPKPMQTSSVWSNYNRYDSTTFSYEPYIPYNETAERVLDGEERNAELRAIFNNKYCLNGALKFPNMNDVSGPASVDAKNEMIFLDTLKFINNKKCDPCNQTCEFEFTDDTLLIGSGGSTGAPAQQLSQNPDMVNGLTQLGSDRQLLTEQFLVRPHDSGESEWADRVEQMWRRIYRGVNDLFIEK